MARTAATQAPAQSRTLPPLIAWRNVLGATIVGWVIVALPNFALLTDYLARTMKNDLVLASFYLDCSFFVSSALVIALVYWWQHAHGETLADLGWGKRSTVTAMSMAVIFGALWTATSYLNTTRNGLTFFDLPWERFVMAPMGIVLAFGEEILFRGFLMEQLRRAGVKTWIQLLVSAATISSYHGLVGFHYFPEYAISGFVLFAIVALIHVIGKRSMTPNLTAHALAHVFGDPALTMGILAGLLHTLK